MDCVPPIGQRRRPASHAARDLALGACSIADTCFCFEGGDLGQKGGERFRRRRV
jgi:hypothetical protein